MELAQYLFGWLCIGFGFFTLTEGYHAFRQRADKAGRPAGYWWQAGLIGAVGFGLIALGLSLEGGV